MRMKFMLLVLTLILSCKHYPADPGNSYQVAEQEGLRVGVVHNPPFTDYEEPSSFEGTEVRLLRKFAERQGLDLLFEHGSESELVRKLEKYKLHILIGGFTRETIWRRKAGFTTPYDRNHVFLIPKGENQLLRHLETFIFEIKGRK